MKKILTGFVCLAGLSTFVHADFLRTEMGVGAWNTEPTGFIEGKSYGFRGVDNADEEKETNLYAWVYFKHFVPIIPNLRVEYVDMTSTGKASGTLSGTTIGVDNVAYTKISMQQIDVIPYYNILDNTFWATIDIGIDLKFVDVSYAINSVDYPQGYSTAESVVFPLLYARGRVEIPTTEFGIEADVKYVEYEDNIVYDIRAKIDYTFDISPVIQPAIEVGYRIQKYQSDETKEIGLELEYSGVYAGVMLRF